VIVAVLDAGFPNLTHEAFARMHIVAEHDFITGADNVRSSNFSAHGTNTLSVVGGMREGELIGPAFGASFILAVTEDARSETPVEEDNWVAAAEWVEAMGADVISSSLGYLEFDRPYTSYTDRDLDGETAISTKAANIAAARGVVVVNSAGNGGFSPVRNTLGAPADGKKVLAVGAVDRDGVRAAFSSVGPTADNRIKPDVAALGVRATVATSAGPATYALGSGTSFSCPLTAGVVALLLQAHPGYTVDQVLFALRSTARQHEAPDNLLGWGIVDGVAAVDVEVPKPQPTPEGALALFRRRPCCLEQFPQAAQ
jgi:subtilisin family serine protease